jgi:DNA-nicking Smr family endonuclease
VRSLSPEEAELWAKVAATIKPLSRTAPAGIDDAPKATERIAAARPPIARPRPSPTPIGQATLDGTWDRRLRSGDERPDRTVDLHGMNLDLAWQAIDRALEDAIAGADRVILLVTGHHRPGEPPVQRGRIRAAVHDWLAASGHASKIAAVRGAHRRHGGGGALYIILRRR